VDFFNHIFLFYYSTLTCPFHILSLSLIVSQIILHHSLININNSYIKHNLYYTKKPISPIMESFHEQYYPNNNNSH
jgi:hypothetical protein